MSASLLKDILPQLKDLGRGIEAEVGELSMQGMCMQREGAERVGAGAVGGQLRGSP